MGLKPYSVLSACRARGRVCLEQLVIHQVVWISYLILRPKTRLWVFFKVKMTLLFTKTSSQKAVSDGAISSYLDQLVSTHVSKFIYGSSSNPDYQYQSLLKTRSPPFLGQGVSVGLSVLSYPKTLTRSCSFPFFKGLSIRRRRNQDDLITGL